MGPDAASRLPTGTVTFLLTDVEGSTRAWESAPTTTADAISRHYALLDEHVRDHGGVRPLEQGEGDSIVAAFARPSEAVAAAVGAQLALRAERLPLRVRMAVHTGEAQLRDENNYFGPTIIRCARIRATGHGGQIIVSDPTAVLVRDHLPDGAHLLDLGLHRLKDLGRPERIWQVVHRDLPSEFPRLRSLDVYRHNLPIQLAPLIGRRQAMSAVAALAADNRLITLTGPGGVGKTRLSLAVAADALDRYPGGVWFVDLAPVDGPDAVARAALAALDVEQLSGSSVLHQLAVELGDEPCLLVLDNCEHVVAECADAVAHLLAANAAVGVLATSREPLGVPGEVVWPVPSLETPPADASAEPTVVSEFDAVRLFVDRARRARPSFALTAGNAPAVASICSHLDGLPLAVELAAARCRHLSPERIAGELGDRFRLLTATGAPVARHQSLAASIAWTHERLDEDEQRAFRRLGVFTGPFTLEAAEAVLPALGALQRADVPELVSRLVDRSLVVFADDTPAPRYRLLETLRAYALREADAANELEELRDAHARAWVRWLAQRFPTLHTDRVAAEVDELHADVLAALNWASVARPTLGLRLLVLLSNPWHASGRPNDIMPAIDRVLAEDRIALDPELWSLTAAAVGVIVESARGVAASRALLERAEAVAGSTGAPFARIVARWLRDFDVEVTRELLAMARERGDPFTEGLCVMALAQAAVDADPAAAGAHLAEAAAMAARAGSSYLSELETRARADAARDLGDLPRSLALATELLDSRSAITTSFAVRLLTVGGLLAVHSGALAAALAAAQRLHRKTPAAAVLVADVEWALALLEGATPTAPPAGGERRPPCAQWLLGRSALEIDAPALALEIAASAGASPLGRCTTAALRAAAADDAAAWSEVLALAVDHELALYAVDALEHLGAAAAHAGRPAGALRRFGTADRLREETGYRWRFPSEHSRWEAARALAAEAAGADAAIHVDEGRSLPWRAGGGGRPEGS